MAKKKVVRKRIRQAIQEKTLKPIKIIPERLKNFNFVLINPEGAGKNPLEKGWQKKEHRFNDPILINHLQKGFNYGVRGGKTSQINIEDKSYFLIVVDFDKKEFQDKIMPLLPETFTTTSGSSKKCCHLWFACDNDKSFKILDENKDTLCDIIGEGKQVIAPNSKHKSGSTYSIIKDIPFAFISYSELQALLLPFDKTPKKPIKEIKNPIVKSIKNDIGSQAVSQVSLKQCLEECGVDTSKDPTNCPFHESKGGKCLSWNNQITAHCFHCEESWNNYSLIRAYKKLSDKETYEWFAAKVGLSEELKKSRKEYNKNSNVNVNKNITTPTLLTTPHYIKSWGYFNKEEKVHIEQLNPKLFIYNFNGKKGLAEVLENRDSQGKLLNLYLNIEGQYFILPKHLYDARLFYNIPSIQLCQDYLSGKYTPRPYNVISKEIKNGLKECFDFNDLVDIEVSSLHIGQSWIKPLLNNFFFYMIDSTLGGGKTTLGEIVYFLNRHGFLGGNISSASIPRLVDELDLNIFIDEIDQNSRDDDILAILRKGQRRGNPYVRCEGRDNRPAAYDVAGSHGGSFRTELEDAFMNRSLRVHTKKSFDYMLPVVNSHKKEIFKGLADELFLWHLDNLVVTCSEEGRVAVISTPSTREKMFVILTEHFSLEEKEFLKKVFGRDNELVYLCLETAKILRIDILENLKLIMNNKARNEASSESFYYDSLKEMLFLQMPKIVLKTLKDGANMGYPYYPKSRLYQNFMSYLKELSVQTIGTKKFSSILRDFGFVEGETITSQRYDAYPTACLIFNKKICDSLNLPFEPIKKIEVEF